MITTWIITDPRAQQLHRFDVLGYLEHMLLTSDPRPAFEQINERYAYGGGWRPLEGWELDENDKLKYPGDPALTPIAHTKLRDELIILYPHAWVAIIQPDRSFEVARMD